MPEDENNSSKVQRYQTETRGKSGEGPEDLNAPPAESISGGDPALGTQPADPQGEVIGPDPDQAPAAFRDISTLGGLIDHLTRLQNQFNGELPLTESEEGNVLDSVEVIDNVVVFTFA